MKNLTRFQKWAVIIFVVLFLINVGIIVTLLASLKVSEVRLSKLGNLMEEMSNSRIQYQMSVIDTIPLESSIDVTDDVIVGIDMVVESSIPFQAMIPVNEKMIIPIHLGIGQVIYVDTTIRIVDEVIINVNDSIPLDQKIKVKKLGGVNMPVSAMIPLQQKLSVSFDTLIRIQSFIPIDMVVEDEMPIDLNMEIPVNLQVPVRIPLNTTAKVSFFNAMPVKAQIPVNLDVPVDIPLNETAMGVYLKKVAEGMRGLTSLSLEDLNEK